MVAETRVRVDGPAFGLGFRVHVSDILPRHSTSNIKKRPSARPFVRYGITVASERVTFAHRSDMASSARLQVRHVSASALSSSFPLRRPLIVSSSLLFKSPLFSPQALLLMPLANRPTSLAATRARPPQYLSAHVTDAVSDASPVRPVWDHTCARMRMLLDI